MFFFVTIHGKKITNHAIILFSFSLKNKSRFETFGRGSIYARSRHYVPHAAPTVCQGGYRGMADSVSYADCRERATPQRSRGARANDHVDASKPRGGDTARRNIENIMRISRARPGGRPVRLETRWPGRAGPTSSGTEILQTRSGLGP